MAYGRKETDVSYLSFHISSQVQKLVDQTNLLLKKNVYKNYTLFIETAREISVLEGEMYQLSHLLTDQKDGLHLLLETSMTNDRLEIPRDDGDAAISKGDDETKKNLAFLLEKVEGEERPVSTNLMIIAHSKNH